MRFPHLATVACCLTFSTAALGYNFKGYYVPQVLISPMKDNVVYTPVGLGIVTSRGGFRVHPVTGHGDFHNGVDLAANLNDRVYCLLDGVVTRVGARGNLGNAVEVYHPYPNVRTIVGHLNAMAVLPGMPVTRGRVIGYAGSTGRSTGVHVHYTVIKEDTNEYIEPYLFIRTVPTYVMQMHSHIARMAYEANLRRVPKLTTKLIDTDTNEVAEDKDEKKGKSTQTPSLEP
ncbi:MAG: M23 family metallopeptidase [Cyanobacteria bacterium SZAS TMP-1]|nr:M23 family metallopeptidase [Cyanobacteria bacterium SZAS TMP-1]